VALTLQGRYGARTSRDDPQNENSSVMHVAAPIHSGVRIIGVLTVAKPNATVQPFIERSQAKIRNRGFLLLAAAAAIGALFTWRLTRSVNRLRRYARDVTEGRRVAPPESGASEIAELGRALAAMREKLEGKQYVEQYVQTLTHELKSPVAAIRGAAELLDEDMPPNQRRRFLANIREQADRLGQVGERMLGLAMVEQRQTLEKVERIEVGPLLESLREALAPRLAARGLSCAIAAEPGLALRGERFLVSQAITNLLENAVDFSPAGGQIALAAETYDSRVRLTVRDHGPGIPDYAEERVFERFYSLPRPDTGRKSTGLGLAFVREVAALHGGEIRLANHPEGGAFATLELPAWPA
jgi:two-component system, OmpR family, sensor histidine kinase CreC